MSQGRPLRISGTDAERLLLAAGSAEKPDSASMRRAAEGLGLLPRMFVFGGVMALVLRSSRWSSVVVRGLVPLASVGAVAIVAYSASERSGPAASTGAAPWAGTLAGRMGNQTDGLPATAPAVQPPIGLAPRPILVGELRPRVAGAAKATTRGVGRAAPAALTADSLREQAELLERARARIASGDSSGGLAVLDDYDRRFAGASLSEEAFLLRVDALARRGDRSAASALGRQFLKTYPASVHADRVSALLHSLSP